MQYYQITDRRNERDRAALSRSAIPFGKNFRSAIKRLGSRGSANGEFVAMPSTVLGDSIGYISTLSSFAFPNGLTHAIEVDHSGTHPSQPFTAIENGNCTSIDLSNPSIDYWAIEVPTFTSPAYLNVSIPQSAPIYGSCSPHRLLQSGDMGVSGGSRLSDRLPNRSSDRTRGNKTWT